ADRPLRGARGGRRRGPDEEDRRAVSAGPRRARRRRHADGAAAGLAAGRLDHGAGGVHQRRLRDALSCCIEKSILSAGETARSLPAMRAPVVVIAVVFGLALVAEAGTDAAG